MFEYTARWSFLWLFVGACSSSSPTPPPAKEAATVERVDPPKAGPDCSFVGKVTHDVTLYKACSPYNIHGGIDVLENVTMTIEAGVEMRFNDGDWFEIAAASTQGGRLIARGTAQDPIVLTSADPATATEKSWLGLWFAAGTRDSVIEHVTIRAAGGSNSYLKPTLLQGCLTLTDVADGALVMKDVQLEDCNVAGAVIRKSKPEMHGFSVRNAPIGFVLDDTELDPAAETKFDRVPEPVVRKSATL